jgi:hypothetical protein
MLDIAVAYNRYKFLGQEFLTWLWWAIDNQEIGRDTHGEQTATWMVGKRVVVEKRTQETLEKITISGDDPEMDEGMLALTKGGLVAEIHLILMIGNTRWEFTIKGESLSFSNIKSADIAKTSSNQEFEGALLEKVYLVEQIFKAVDNRFAHFLQARLDQDWDKTRLQIKNWLQSKNQN